MKVIKHGKEYNPRQVACKKCECFYEWEDWDVKVAASGNAALHNSQMEEHKWVICPECGFLNYLQGGNTK